MNVLLHPQTDVGFDEEIKKCIAAGQYQPPLPPEQLFAMDIISDLWPDLLDFMKNDLLVVLLAFRVWSCEDDTTWTTSLA
jgi:hypothetical protein